jgi:hypothetical protein
MAQHTIVQLWDDLEPDTEATDTVAFGLDNHNYEIDLSDKHIDELRGLFAKYITAARKVSSGRSAPVRPTTSQRTDLPKQVRAWAAEHGVALSTRGRISGPVMAAFEAKDVNALKAAVGQTPEPESTESKPRRGRRAKESPAPEFSGA